MTDPVISQIREQITNLDRTLVEAVNKRIELVQQLRGYKERNGVPFLDPAREEWMLTYLTRENSGPLSEEGLAELYAYVLELTKRETGQLAAKDG